MNERTIDIATYWPRVVGDTGDFKEIATAENPEFNLAQSRIYAVLKDGFIPDATAYGVARWEAMLDLHVTPDMTLEERKEQILKYLSINLPYTWRVLKQLIADLIGEENFNLTFDNETQTLTIAYASTVTDLQFEQVANLIERVVPQNIVIEITELPLGYTRLDYLETTGYQWLRVDDLHLGSTSEVNIKFAPTDMTTWFSLFSCIRTAGSARVGSTQHSRKIRYDYINQGYVYSSSELTEGSIYHVRKCGERNFLNGIEQASNKASNFTINAPTLIGKEAYASTLSHMRIFDFKASANIEVRLVPALDETGTPCMFDSVTRTPYYNKGTGDFLYPGAEQAVQTLDLDLDAKSYAKLTEHGIRRLYHVPKGYTGTKDQYAAEHGFKELVEPPAPYEGYWTPQWRETETQLICDWIETEPQTEVSENE